MQCEENCEGICEFLVNNCALVEKVVFQTCNFVLINVSLFHTQVSTFSLNFLLIFKM